jgi:hypothetical protein
MEVVQTHCGSPRTTTTAQNAKMIRRRVHAELLDSGGGSRGVDASGLSSTLPRDIAPMPPAQLGDSVLSVSLL